MPPPSDSELDQRRPTLEFIEWCAVILDGVSDSELTAFFKRQAGWKRFREEALLVRSYLLASKTPADREVELVPGNPPYDAVVYRGNLVDYRLEVTLAQDENEFFRDHLLDSQGHVSLSGRVERTDGPGKSRAVAPEYDLEKRVDAQIDDVLAAVRRKKTKSPPQRTRLVISLPYDRHFRTNTWPRDRVNAALSQELCATPMPYERLAMVSINGDWLLEYPLTSP